jgi:cellulose synthase (UDP-forming)
MRFLKRLYVSPYFLILNLVLSVTYFVCITTLFQIGNPYLFGLLVAGEVFHLWQVIGYLYTIWPRARVRQFDESYQPDVAVFITVCGEPEDVIEETVRAALAMEYPHFSIYILNDGFVAKRDNWREAEHIAEKYGVTCITRQVPGGAKAGNINNAVKHTKEPFVAVFDADHVPDVSFLKEMVGYFTDKKVAFVQSPQYYKNFEENLVTGGAWDQQALFFGAIMQGKDRTNTAFMCGTNMVIRRSSLIKAGGMSEESIAEDFLTSLLIHQSGGKSVYVGKVLAQGLAPEDFLSYYKQQFRWARGSLEVIFRYNPLFRKGLSISQRIEYLSSSSYYLSGLIVLLNAVLPLVYLYAGLEPLAISTMTLAMIFLPYIFIVLYTIQLTSNFTFTFRALSFSLSSFPIHIKAVAQILIGRKSAFAVTSKKKLKGNYGYLVIPHIAYIVLVIIGIGVGYVREGFTPSVITNIAWSFIYIAIFIPFITAAFEKDEPEPANDQADTLTAKSESAV